MCVEVLYFTVTITSGIDDQAKTVPELPVQRQTAGDRQHLPSTGARQRR